MSEWIGEYCSGKILKSIGSLSRMGHVDAAGFIYLSDLGTRDMTELLRLYFLCVYFSIDNFIKIRNEQSFERMVTILFSKT